MDLQLLDAIWQYFIEHFGVIMSAITFAVVIGFVVQPLFSPRAERGENAAAVQSALALRKQSLLEQIKELELEYEMGTVSPGDFQRNRNELKREASTIIDQLESPGGKPAGTSAFD